MIDPFGFFKKKTLALYLSRYHQSMKVWPGIEYEASKFFYHIFHPLLEQPELVEPFTDKGN